MNVQSVRSTDPQRLGGLDTRPHYVREGRGNGFLKGRAPSFGGGGGLSTWLCWAQQDVQPHGVRGNPGTREHSAWLGVLGRIGDRSHTGWWPGSRSWEAVSAESKAWCDFPHLLSQITRRYAEFSSALVSINQTVPSERAMQLLGQLQVRAAPAQPRGARGAMCLHLLLSLPLASPGGSGEFCPPSGS